MIRLLSLAVAAFAVPAQAAEQFDLVCAGEEEITRALESPPKETSPFEIRLRIDLEEGRYCSEECNGTAPIFEVSDTRIEFAEPFERDRVRGTSAFYVSRTSGELSWYNFPPSRTYASAIEAVCKVEPFSGFPAVERQF